MPAYTARLSPLVFQRPSPIVTLSDEQKAEITRDALTLRTERYRRTAQYAEALLQFYPALIRQCLPFQATSRGLVGATY